MTPHAALRDFLDILEARYPIDGANMRMSEWICRNTKLGGKPFSYENYEFQVALADDMHSDLACIKCAQVGLTENEIRKFLGFLARNKGTTGIYTLNDEKLFRRVSKMRVRPLVKNERAFNLDAGGQPARAMDMYEISGSFAIFTGMTESDATSTPADILFHDEYDLSDMAMVALFQSRLQNSAFRIRQRFSTPTYPGFGIDAAYAASDQHEYFIRCAACGRQQIPEFDLRFLRLPGYSGEDILQIGIDEAASIDFAASWLKCERCSARLPIEDPSAREWVAKFPGRLTRGYRVTPFCTKKLTPAYVIGQQLKHRELGDMKGWWNTVLGKPYIDAAAQIAEADIRKCLRSPAPLKPAPGEGIWIGADVGDVCHLVWGVRRPGKTIVCGFEQVKADELPLRIEELATDHRLVRGAADRHPYTPTINQIREQTARKVLPVEYRGQATLFLVKDEFGAISHAQANRTPMLDEVAEAVRALAIEFNGYGALDALLITHLRNMVREAPPEGQAVWRKLHQSDHFFHALAFLIFSFKLHEAYEALEPPIVHTEFALMSAGDIEDAPPPDASALTLSHRRQERRRQDGLRWPST